MNMMLQKKFLKKLFIKFYYSAHVKILSTILFS